MLQRKTWIYISYSTLKVKKKQTEDEKGENSESSCGQEEHFFKLEENLVISGDNEICEACDKWHRRWERENKVKTTATLGLIGQK
jgi:hypothetical protein